LLGAEILTRTGRYPLGLADRRIFQTPFIAQLFSRLGAVEGTPDAGLRILAEGNLLVISPGGMRESLRPSTRRYHIDWQGRLGFVRLAVQAQVPVVLAGCPAADDIFTVYENPVTPLVYGKFKWPLPIWRGLGLSPIPRPVKLVHTIRAPLYPPPLRNGKADDRDVRAFHAELQVEMENLLQDGD